jgi:hypothetical protein
VSSSTIRQYFVVFHHVVLLPDRQWYVMVDETPPHPAEHVEMLLKVNNPLTLDGTGQPEPFSKFSARSLTLRKGSLNTYRVRKPTQHPMNGTLQIHPLPRTYLLHFSTSFCFFDPFSQVVLSKGLRRAPPEPSGLLFVSNTSIQLSIARCTVTINDCRPP